MSSRFSLVLCVVVLSSFMQVRASDSVINLLGNNGHANQNDQVRKESLVFSFDNGLQSTWLVHIPFAKRALPVVSACHFCTSEKNVVKPIGSRFDFHVRIGQHQGGGSIYFFGVSSWGTIQGHPVEKLNDGCFVVKPAIPASPGNFDLMKNMESDSFWVMVIPGFGKERMEPPAVRAELRDCDELVTVESASYLAPIFKNRMRPYWQAYVFATNKDGQIAVVPTYVKSETEHSITFTAPKPIDFH